MYHRVHKQPNSVFNAMNQDVSTYRECSGSNKLANTKPVTLYQPLIPTKKHSI